MVWLQDPLDHCLKTMFGPKLREWGAGDTMELKPSAELTERQAAAIVQVTETEKFVKSLGKGEQLMSRERSIKLSWEMS